MPSSGGRRQRVVTRALPLIAIAAAAFIAGAIVSDEPPAPAAQRFLDAWERGDTEAMYAELTAGAQETYPLERFQRAYDDAATASTLASLETGEVSEQDDVATAPVTMRTHI